MKRGLYWLALNGGLAAAVWFGWWHGVEGARNLVSAFAVMCALVGIALVQKPVIQKLADDTPQPGLRSAGSWMVTWFTLCTLVWHGALLTGSAWAFWMLCASAAKHASNKLRAEQGERA